MSDARHIVNYETALRLAKRFFDDRAENTRRRREELVRALVRLRAGETGIELNGVPADEKGLVSTIEGLNTLLDAKIVRGKPRKGSLLRWKEAVIERIGKADRAPKFTGLVAKTEWKRSSTWGRNPVTEVWITTDGKGELFPRIDPDTGKVVKDPYGNGRPDLSQTWYRIGRATGYGYDKLSASVGDAIGECPSMDRLILENSKSWECYAVEKDPFPHLSIDGKGIDVLRTPFIDMGRPPAIPGFHWTYESGKTWNLVKIEMK